jgi:hypothetical protein
MLKIAHRIGPGLQNAHPLHATYHEIMGSMTTAAAQ